MEFRYERHLIVVYHDDCIDGFASAWAFDQALGGDAQTHISYIPYGHHNIPDAEKHILRDIDAGAELFFVDVAPGKAFLDKLMSPGGDVPALKSIRIIDHHQSAADVLAGYQPPAAPGAPALDIFIEANAPAAALLVWKALMPAEAPKPAFLRMIEKMDLSRDLKDEDDLAAAALIDSKSLRSVGEAFSSFMELSALSLPDMVQAGRGIFSDQKNRIDKLTDNIMYTRLEALEDILWVPVINADVQNFGRQISDYLREQGEKTGLGMAFAWYVQGNGSVTMSIRSDGDPDASQIAKLLCTSLGARGGGHKTSAAVHFPSLRFFTEKVPLFTEDEMICAKKRTKSA